MKLREGQIAPNFKATDIDGNPVELIQFKGKKVAVGFYRNVNCPFCNRRVHKLMANSVRLKQQNIQLIFIFESSNKKLKASIFHQGISPWPLVGDSEKKLYAQYGVENSPIKMMRTMFHSSLSTAKKETKELNLPEDKDASMNLIPADFFIDEFGKIVKAHYGKHIDDHVAIEELNTFAGL